MYQEYFGLAAKPFSKTPDPAFLFESRGHAEALARLSHAVEERELAVLTGEVGAGKTTLTRALVDRYADRCRFVLLVDPSLPPAQLTAAIADGLGVKLGRRAPQGAVTAALAEELARLDEAGKFPVVIVDEAQLLAGRRAFDALRLLTNLTADDRGLIGILLVGQPELRERLRDKGVEPFAQRVGVAYHLAALAEDEVALYLAHRLRVAGREEPLFTFEAAREIARWSGGLPRRVNQLAASCLLEAFAREAGEVDAEVVQAAARDIDAYLGRTGS